MALMFHHIAVRKDREREKEREAGSNSRSTLVTHVDHAAVLAPKHAPFSLCRGALCRVTSFCCAASHGSFFQPDAPRAACDTEIKFYVVPLPEKLQLGGSGVTFFVVHVHALLSAADFGAGPPPGALHTRLVM